MSGPPNSFDHAGMAVPEMPTDDDPLDLLVGDRPRNCFEFRAGALIALSVFAVARGAVERPQVLSGGHQGRLLLGARVVPTVASTVRYRGNAATKITRISAPNHIHQSGFARARVVPGRRQLRLLTA